MRPLPPVHPVTVKSAVRAGLAACSHQRFHRPVNVAFEMVLNFRRGLTAPCGKSDVKRNSTEGRAAGLSGGVLARAWDSEK